MSSSEPPSSKSLDAAWGTFGEDPASEPGERERPRKVRPSVPFFRGEPTIEEASSSDERETLPPPVPVSEYVQTMMQQAQEEPEPTSSPRSWRSATPPSSRRRAEAERSRAPAPGRRVEGWNIPPAPPLPLPPPVDEDDTDGFTLIVFEPERLGDQADDGDRPSFNGLGVPGLDDLPFPDDVAPSTRGVTISQYPTPIPERPSTNAPQSVAISSLPPLSRGEPPLASIPPIVGAAWPSSPFGRSAFDIDLNGEAPATQRGLAGPPPDTRTPPGAPRYGAASSGDAGALPRPPIAPQAPLLAVPAAPPVTTYTCDDVRELYDAGDFRSALVMAEALLEGSPDHDEAQAYAASCRELLAKKYLGRLGGLAKILRVAMPPDEIRWLSLDHKAGFLLSCIDGTSSIEEVLDVACMHEFEAIRILHDFRELGVIEILPDPRMSRR
jgi:hypothetical protein